ncbi:MAG: 3-oxoacyl-ACP synthase III family protein [Alphaproteobacteria bacterium]
MNARIEAIAYALPDTVLSNATLKQSHPDWDFERLEERTGVIERRIAGPDETALDLAERASRDLDLDGVDGLIFCTETPDHPIPSNACLLHGRLGLAKNVLALDINMGCSGYVYSLEVARALITAGTATRILLATGDTYSRLINPGDRATRVLFGDGAAASIIAATDDEGIRDITLGSSGAQFDRFMVPAGGARRPFDAETGVETTDKSGNIRSPENITMDGFGVLSFFNATIPGEVTGLLQKNNITMDDVDAFVFHQASRVALQSIQRALKIPDAKMIDNMARVGNLVSASVPVALQMAIDEGRVKPGDRVVLCGFGVGLSWASALVRI